MDLAEYKKMDELEKAHPWFIAKRSFLSLTLKKYLPAPAKILDVGCGTGEVLDFLSELRYEVEGIDPSEEALRYCGNKSLKVKSGTAEMISFDNDSFDGVLALDVLEHLADDSVGVKELCRILKPNGLAIITVPAHPSLFSIHDKKLHHFRRYSKKQLSELFDDGWEIKRISWIHSLILLPVALNRLLAKVGLKKDQSSDVKAVGKNLSKILNLAYRIELFFYGFLGSLPFGLSLLIVAQKKKYERDN